MTEKEIKETLNVSCDEDSCLIIINDRQWIDITVFLEMFGDSDLTYESLISNKNSSIENGWRDTFKRWRDEGKLN